ncbi:MAG TPA: hypothetical protein VE891_08955 [Allosphingosinicella sp.]|nr:hypothetical protein [Allosphingosinicella sp.]
MLAHVGAAPPWTLNEIRVTEHISRATVAGFTLDGRSDIRSQFAFFASRAYMEDRYQSQMNGLWRFAAPFSFSPLAAPAGRRSIRQRKEKWK